jgi:hypothetical protein
VIYAPEVHSAHRKMLKGQERWEFVKTLLRQLFTDGNISLPEYILLSLSNTKSVPIENA